MTADERLEAMRERAHDLIVASDALEEAGLVRFARRSRVVARDLLTAVGEVRTERVARVAVQADRDRAVDLLAARAGAALTEGESA